MYCKAQILFELQKHNHVLNLSEMKSLSVVVLAIRCGPRYQVWSVFCPCHIVQTSGGIFTNPTFRVSLESSSLQTWIRTDSSIVPCGCDVSVCVFLPRCLCRELQKTTCYVQLILSHHRSKQMCYRHHVPLFPRFLKPPLMVLSRRKEYEMGSIGGAFKSKIQKHRRGSQATTYQNFSELAHAR